MLSFKQNFLDLLLGRQPNVRALCGQAVPPRSKASLSSPAGASRDQLSAPAGLRLHQHMLCSSSPGRAAGLQEPLREERGPAVKFQSKETPAPGVSQHSIPAFAPSVFWLQTGHVITTWGPSWLLRGKSRRPLLLDRPSQALLWIKDKESFSTRPKGFLSTAIIG